MYIVDELTKALGGKKLTDSRTSVVRNWSPNNVKSIFISVDFILISNHVGGMGGSRAIPLDRNLVGQDIAQSQTVYGNPKLNTVLDKRSFSCLEEIYIDYVLVGVPALINLDTYAQKMAKGTNRLRYIGAGDFSAEHIEWIKGIYLAKHEVTYSVAKDSTRPFKLSFVPINEEDWYKHYYLRPQYYQMDAENGGLAMHFRKFEKDYVAQASKLQSDATAVVREQALKALIAFDMANLGLLGRLNKLGVALESHTGKLDVIVKSALKESITTPRKVDGLLLSDIQSITPSELVDWYKRSQIFKVKGEKGEQGISLENLNARLEKKQGFLDVYGILDDFTYSLVKNLTAGGYKILVNVGLTMKANELPPCKILEKKGITQGPETNSIEGFFSLIGELVGKPV